MFNDVMARHRRLLEAQRAYRYRQKQMDDEILDVRQKYMRPLAEDRKAVEAARQGFYRHRAQYNATADNAYETERWAELMENELQQIPLPLTPREQRNNEAKLDHTPMAKVEHVTPQVTAGDYEEDAYEEYERVDPITGARSYLINGVWTLVDE